MDWRGTAKGMSIERHYSLRRAAKLVGVSHHTLKKWLREDLGRETARVPRGSKVLISGTELEFVLRRRKTRKVRT